jgi:hypothetical protein
MRGMLREHIGEPSLKLESFELIVEEINAALCLLSLRLIVYSKLGGPEGGGEERDRTNYTSV